MHKPLLAISIALLALSPKALAQSSNETLASVAKPPPVSRKSPLSASADEPATQPPVVQLKAQKTKPTETNGQEPSSATPAVPQAIQTPASTQASPQEKAALQPSALQLSHAQYKAQPSAQNLDEFLRVFKSFLAQAGVQKIPAAAIVKTNPALSDLGARATETGSGRIWTFPRLPFQHEAIVQWQDTKASTTFVGRRRVKHVTYSTVSRIQSLTLPQDVVLKEARVIGSEEGARYLILVGEVKGSTLWLHAYKAQDGSWIDSPHHFDSIPSFLTDNVSGKVAFRGSDLIFNVGRVVPASGEQTSGLPEAESSTYRFWLKHSENGYVLQGNLPDLSQFGTVRQFLEAIANNRTDTAKSMLLDAKLLSIPRYIGVKGPSSAFHVVQMASPHSGVPRYRIITGQKNDLILDVGRTRYMDLGKVKEKPVIKAMFIAAPDPFLTAILKVLPNYDHLIPPAPEPVETASAEPKHP